MNTISSMVATVLKGLLLIIVGIMTLAKPMHTIEILTLYFGIAVGIRGVVLLYNGFRDRKMGHTKNWTLFNATMDIVFGSVLLFHPKITLGVLPFLIGMWAILSGLLESAIASTQDLKQSWPKFLFGILILIFGWVIILHPAVTDIAFSYLFGGFLIFIGLGYIVIRITLHRLISE